MKIIIAGSRGFNDYELLQSICDSIVLDIRSSNPPNIEIVSGKAKGADLLGERYANNRDIPVKEFPADWKKFGKSAGYKRNEEMAKYSDYLIAFWDFESKGTKHMIDLAHKHKLKVKVIRWYPTPSTKPIEYKSREEIQQKERIIKGLFWVPQDPE